MKIGIVGSRGFNDYEQLQYIMNNFKDVSEIISGGAKGADTLGEKYADDNTIEKTIHYPDLEKYGKGGYFIRNSKIVRDSDLVIAFWDGVSRGTRDTISKAHKEFVPVLVVHYNNF